jgi:hypothetical protein
MRDDRHVVRRRHCSDSHELGQATEPHDIRLDNVDAAVRDELPEAVTRVLRDGDGKINGTQRVSRLK